MAVRVAVDAMGGDHAPGEVISGAIRAVRQADGDLKVLLYGPEPKLRAVLAAHEPDPRISVVHAPDVIGMGEVPVAAVRAKPRSSIHLGLRGHRAGAADAFLSAGNTGAVVAASLFLLKRLSGAKRPSIPSFFPTTAGACILLDVGSNMDSRPEHLVQFARMGSAYARIMAEIEQPRVALLNVGEEPAKGNELVRKAHEMLTAAQDINFVGNVEGQDILHHRAEVIVCDGFVGNVVLKLVESIGTALPRMAEQELDRLEADPAARRVLSRIFKRLRRRFNPADYGGGAPLLGVDGEVFILHGRSSADAVERCIQLAARAARLNLNAAIKEAIAL
ncbi:MAG: phosphate acyltransferase PlsX [Bacteroidota bacterium]|nr:phosphate acyltransferase PlsX [Bacteroidota bacterium]MDE2956354.1 phosphate acyltransferase PlsX [Bacteroidota bacterium]